MLKILGRPRRTCAGWTRREVLQAGGAGLLGLSLPKLLAAETAAPAQQPRAKNVIFLFLFGGPSQLESFDLKPTAPTQLERTLARVVDPLITGPPGPETGPGRGGTPMSGQGRSAEPLRNPPSQSSWR